MSDRCIRCGRPEEHSVHSLKRAYHDQEVHPFVDAPAAADLAQALKDMLEIWDGSEDGMYCYSNGPIEKLPDIRKLMARVPPEWLEDK